MKTMEVSMGILRVLIIVVFLGLVVAQLFSLPGQFSHLAGERPQLGAVPWLLLVFAILEVLCLQVVLVCLWRLLSLVTSDHIFSDRAFGWVNVLVGTIAFGWLLLLAASIGVSTLIYLTPQLRDPGIPILLLGAVLIGGVVVLTVGVMRALLKQATVLRSDLNEVI